jgi:hypothetical protein
MLKSHLYIKPTEAASLYKSSSLAQALVVTNHLYKIGQSVMLKSHLDVKPIEAALLFTSSCLARSDQSFI